MYMAKHSKIDMGPLTEDLPEWSISSEIKVEDLKKKETRPDRGASAGMALDSEFVLDGTITSPGSATSQVHAGNAQINSLLDEGTLLSVPQGDIDRNEGVLDIHPERKTKEIAGQFLDDGELFFEQQIEEPAKPRATQSEELIFEPSLEQLMDQASEPKTAQPKELYDSPSLEQLLEETSGVEASLNEASGLEAATEEPDQVDEHLGYLASSMKDWEQSENALSEAAAMLLNISGGRSEDENKEELESLRQGLDNITASIHRMSASAREDMADVIEQTQRDNELFEAVQAETASAEQTAWPNVDRFEKAPSAPKTVQMKTLDPLDESESSGMDVDQILERYKASSSKTANEPIRQVPEQTADVNGKLPEQAADVNRRQAEQIRTAGQPADGSKTVVMKTLTPLDENETSGMNVNGIAELYKKPESKRTKVSKHESERKHIKASKHESERKRGKALDQEFEITVIPEGEETADGFRFVIDKGIVENPVEWRIDASFQSGGQDRSDVQADEAEEDDDDVLTVSDMKDQLKKQEVEAEESVGYDDDVLTVSDVEDQLKKQEVEVKRRRVEKSRMENSSGFAYALSDLK